EDHQGLRVQRAERLQNGIGGAYRFLIWLWMAPRKVAVTRELRRLRAGIGDDALHGRPNLLRQALGHAMAGLAEGNSQYARIRLQVVEIVANAQHAALIVHVPRESPLDAGFVQRVRKDFSRHGAHVDFGRHQPASTCRPAAKCRAVQSRMAACISGRWPSKKWSAPSTMTSSFGSGANSTSRIKFCGGLYWSCEPLTKSLGLAQSLRKP